MKLITEQQVIASPYKLILAVADGLGGLPQHPGGKTELETANTPNLDRLAAEGSLGLLDPIGPGITPGSGPAHLALFGYDPIENNVGRGLLSALGNDFPIEDIDILARGNYCTLDADRNIIDRRAGRIPTAESSILCERLEKIIDLGEVKAFVRPEQDHRFLLVLRAPGLSDQLDDTDPQATGVPPRKCRPLNEHAAKTARLVDEFTHQAQEILADQKKANGVLLRGFARKLPLPSITDRFGIRAAALADYPMYRGLAQLVGMVVISREKNLFDRAKVLTERREDFDFFYFHYKKTDAKGEDGNFQAKVEAVEEFDSVFPLILEAKPDVLIVTGDHSTPAMMASHSWHPVPMLLWGRYVRTDAAQSFGETEAIQGGLGRMPMMQMMPLALAHAGRLIKFGA